MPGAALSSISLKVMIVSLTSAAIQSRQGRCAWASRASRPATVRGINQAFISGREVRPAPPAGSRRRRNGNFLGNKFCKGLGSPGGGEWFVVIRRFTTGSGGRDLLPWFGPRTPSSRFLEGVDDSDVKVK